LPKLKGKDLQNLDFKNKLLSKNRAESQSFELQLEKKRRLFEEKIKELKIEKGKTIKLISSILHDIDDLTLSLELLRNFDKYYDVQDMIKKTIETIQYEDLIPEHKGGKRKKTEEEWERMNQVRNNIIVIDYFNPER
jgi:hypothetical protein